MRTDDFDFDMPDELIALRPAEPRESARLLVIERHRGVTAEARIADLPSFLLSTDTLVVNDTRVIPCALTGRREREGTSVAISATLHRKQGDDAWWAFAKPGRRLRQGDVIRFGVEGEQRPLLATVQAKGDNGEVLLVFDQAAAALDGLLEAIGTMPLPPYIASRRAADRQDRSDYQTVYADRKGSVAAPTAGLHLSGSLLKAVRAKGIDVEKITLHVGGGTFLPVKTDDISQHHMHAEWGDVRQRTAERLRQRKEQGGRLIAVGTTSARLLESAARATGQIDAFEGDTDIFITPGFRFAAIDGLLTNFHLPRSTLFMLVCAFAGYEVMHEAYAHAIKARYRFFSYGDACLLLP